MRRVVFVLVALLLFSFPCLAYQDCGNPTHTIFEGVASARTATDFLVKERIPKLHLSQEESSSIKEKIEAFRRLADDAERNHSEAIAAKALDEYESLIKFLKPILLKAKK